MFQAAPAQALRREQSCFIQESEIKQVLQLHWIELGGKSKVKKPKRQVAIGVGRALQGGHRKRLDCTLSEGTADLHRHKHARFDHMIFLMLHPK